MVQKLKRAFTITELVIVIAVVAILAAVLIPTFSNIINKANESADTQLVKNLNTILSSEQTVSQEAAPTMSKALEQAQSGGYTVDKLTPTSDGDILWEQESNRFVLVSGGEILFKDSATTADIATEPYKFWKITNKESEVTDGEYSHYLADGFTGTAFTVKAGIDTGENTTVTSITYSSPVKSAPAAGAERTVIINTNKNRCNVIVDALFDTVKRYGDAETVSVNYTASQSYHEFGDVNTLVVGEGHVYVDEGGYVGILDCTNAGDATVGKASTGTINSVLVKDHSSAESILEDSVKTAIENGETEQVKEAEVPEESGEFAGGLGTEKSPFLIETAEQFVAIGQLSDDMLSKSYYFRLVDDIDLTEVEDDLNNYGDSTYPDYGYVIISYYFSGELDGDGHTIYSGAYRTIEFNEETVGDARYCDLTVVQRGGNSAFTFAYCVNRIKLGEVVFENIRIDGIEENTVLFYGNNGSSFVSQVQGDVKFIDCVNSVVLSITSGSGYAGIFIGGYAFYSAPNPGENKPGSSNEQIARVVFKNCVNEAEVTGVSIGFFTGNANQAKFALVNSEAELATAQLDREKAQAYAYVENCRNMGTMIGSVSCGAFSRGNLSLKPEHNALANDALDETNANGTSRFTANATMVEGSSVEDSTLFVDNEKNVKITPTANETVAVYSLNISVPITYLKGDTTETNGSSYVSVTIDIPSADVAGWSSPIVTRILASTTYEEEGGGSVSFTKEDERGHKYAEVLQDDGSMWLIVDYDSLLAHAFDDTGKVVVGNPPSYLMKFLSATGGIYGSIRYNVVEGELVLQ